jgi:conjugative relaxase-like TrwC/TraI family protein
MSVSIGKGYDTKYMTDAVEGGRETYYTDADAAGEPAGLWHGAGAQALGLVGEVDAEQMTALFAHRIDPRDPAAADTATWGQAGTLGAKPRAFKNAEQRYTALLEQNPDAGPELRAALRAQAEKGPGNVPFYDVTLSAPKSVTVLWVACERAANDARAAGVTARAAGELSRADGLDAQAREWAGRARAIEESLLAGHRAALDYLADRAGYVRAGHHGGGGGKWLDAHQLVTAQFLQHDSRDRDPQLHVHGPILNLAEGPDGKWRRLDGQGIFREKAAASAIGDRVTEAEITRRLGARFETRPDGLAREIVGVEQDEMDLFSSRRRAIGPAAEKLMRTFREETGREPNGLQRHRLYQQATLATRARKSHAGETRDGQMIRWAAKAQTALGRDLADIAARVFGQAPAPAVSWSETDVIERALAAVAESKQAWTRSDLLGHISSALPGNLGLAAHQVRQLLEGLADKALASTSVLRVDHAPRVDQLPDEYHRADGSSVFSRPGSARRYATETQLRGEHELREAAVRRGAPVLAAAKVQALVDRRAELRMPFNPDQEAAVRGILTSGAAVQVVCAPAGTGKSFLVGALAEAWEAGQVRGLAFGQRQADILTEEGVTSRNIAHWLVGQQRLDEGRAQPGDEQFRLHRGDLLVVDEAQLAGNANLVRIARRCEAAGAMLVLAGDPAQGGMGASGGLTDVAERGISYELAEVRRFSSDWEGPASLRLRDGDTSVVGEYAKHGRLVDAGSIEQAEAGAARAWLADTLNGHESLVITATNEGAARVCAQLRAELVALGRVQETGVTLGRQGTTAGVGDLIQARHPDRARGLVNRALFRVTEVLSDGGLGVVPVSYDKAGEVRGTPRTIPADYVREHVALGYASTGAAAIGRTVYSGYPILTPGMDAADGYVVTTRGAETNVAFVVTQAAPAADSASGETARAARRGADAVFAEIITRPELDVDQTRTAVTQHEQSEALARATGSHVDPMASVIADVTAGQAGAVLDRLAAESVLAVEDRLALAADPAMGTVEQLLRTAELARHDPAVVLRDAVTARDFNHAISPAQVLHSRIRTALHDQLTANLSSYADLVPTSSSEALRPALEEWAAAADDRRYELGGLTAENPPQWAREALGPVPDDALERAEWEHKAGWAASYREWAGLTDDADALGAAPPAGLGEKHAVWQTAHAALGLIDVTPDEEKRSDGQLRNRVAAWARELNWAPRYVADELAATHEALRRHETDATVWAARAVGADRAEREQLLEAAVEAARQAETLAGQVKQLELADHARGEWYSATATTREYATRARAALETRGIDLDITEDRVTATEWLEAHQAEQAEADQHREIRDEADLHEPAEAAEAAQVERAERLANAEPNPQQRPGREREADLVELETDLPDIRETSNPDESERVDPAEPRRVPRVDETAATVERAQAALTEIDTRQVRDADSEAHAATEEPEESARAVELHRWSEDDRAAEQAHTDADTFADAE